MRLGGHVFNAGPEPEQWVAAVKACGYRAAFCPVGDDVDADRIRDFERAAAAADIVIAEVGAWSNPICPDDSVRLPALELNRRRLALADQIGARCCVNIAGSRNPEVWDGPHPDNLTRETFDLIVETVRGIIDDVKPRRTRYCLETMPWIYPYSADSYVELIRAIDRPQFAVHLDPVNLINSPERWAHNGDIIRECFAKLGPHIVSCHAKDIAMSRRLTVHLDEAPPGQGQLDYHAYLSELHRLPADTPLMLEHLRTAEEYAAAAKHIRGVAAELEVSL